MLGASEIARQFVASGDGSFVLPVIAYYSTDRLWAQVPKKDLSKEDFSSSRTKGYEQALHASANSARIVVGLGSYPFGSGKIKRKAQNIMP